MSNTEVLHQDCTAVVDWTISVLKAAKTDFSGNLNKNNDVQ